MQELDKLKEEVLRDEFLGKKELLQELQRVCDEMNLIVKFPEIRDKLKKAYQEEVRHSRLNHKRCREGPWEKYWFYRELLFEKAIEVLVGGESGGREDIHRG